MSKMTEYRQAVLCSNLYQTTSEVDYVSSLMRSDETSVQVHCVCMCVVLIGVAVLYCYSEQRAIQVKRREDGEQTYLYQHT